MGLKLEDHPVVINRLSFSYNKQEDILKDISFRIPPASRLVLVGRNGAGKSTLLSLIAGRRMAAQQSIFVYGKDPFRTTSVQEEVCIVTSDWLASEVMKVSMRVGDVLENIAASSREEEQEEVRERMGRLKALLGVEEDWRFSSISEGQKRRVQLTMKLMRPSRLILLDEATTDLDLIVRRNLLGFLLLESLDKRACVVYCTHIFDGLEGWASHLAHLADGSLLRMLPCRDVPELQPNSDAPGFFALVSRWLGEEAGVASEEEAVADVPMAREDAPVSMQASELEWGYHRSRPPILSRVSFTCKQGERVLLAGANGAGKSTLLSILAGQRLVSPPDCVLLLGCRAFEDYRKLSSKLVLLSQEWRSTLRTCGAGGSVSFEELCRSLLQDCGSRTEEVASRLQRLAKILQVESSWKPNEISDGQLRRMQLALKLAYPCEVMLLDEATVDLDVLGRAALLAFLKSESVERGVTVIYCTHILDGMSGWATRVLYMSQGCLESFQGKLLEEEGGERIGSKLYRFVQRLLIKSRQQPVAAST